MLFASSLYNEQPAKVSWPTHAIRDLVCGPVPDLYFGDCTSNLWTPILWRAKAVNYRFIGKWKRSCGINIHSRIGFSKTKTNKILNNIDRRDAKFINFHVSATDNVPFPVCYRISAGHLFRNKTQNSVCVYNKCIAPNAIEATFATQFCSPVPTYMQKLPLKSQITGLKKWNWIAIANVGSFKLCAIQI